MSNIITDYAMELLIDEAILYADDVEDIKSELSGDDYATAMMRELGITSDEALFGEM